MSADKSMVPYIVQQTELSRILRNLGEVLKLRLCFFDLRGDELTYLDVKPLSSFCSKARRVARFDQACRSCDQRHLELAKSGRSPVCYRCHAGLYEAVIPLYDRDQYLGAIVFGQIRPMERGLSYPPAARGLPRHRFAEVQALARHLKDVSEYILIKELVRLRKKSWLEKTEAYIAQHLAEPLTLGELSRISGKSVSAISHQFRKEFGQSPRQYILQRKLDGAAQLVRSGESIRVAAMRFQFHDAYHFSKLFKKHRGFPPSRLKTMG